MASIDDGELYLEVEGASEKELQAGLRAVRSVFERADCSIEDAFHARFEREGADLHNLLAGMPADVFDHAAVIDNAMAAGLNAATKGWLEKPYVWNIGLYASLVRSNRELAEMGAEVPDTGPHYRMPSTVSPGAMDQRCD